MSNTEKQELARRENETVGTVEQTRRRPLFSPPVDIMETADKLILWADVPGVDEKSLDITLENGVLTIRGNSSVTMPERYRQLDGEYDAGDYERVFSISSEIDQEKIEAKVNNGVLCLHLPKAEIARPRKIEVQAG